MKTPTNAQQSCFFQRSSASRVARSLIDLVVLSAVSVVAQNTPTTPSNVRESTRIYAQLCAGCHGADAHGTDNAPGLVGNQGLRERSVQDLRDLAGWGRVAASRAACSRGVGGRPGGAV